MSDFHRLFRKVHCEIWDSGVGATPELSGLLAELECADLPEGVTRLPTARLAPGPHIAAQTEHDLPDERVAWLETRRLARERERALAIR